jgi:excisionase family DNA binding protein
VDNSKLLTSDEVAERLRRSRGWVQENHKRLGLYSVKLGRQYLFPSDSLELWIQAQETSKQEKAPTGAQKAGNSKLRIVPRAS